MASDPVALLYDLRRRVERLESGQPGTMRPVPPPSMRPPRLTRRQDPETIGILHYLQTSQTRQEDTAENDAIVAWLNTPKKKTGPAPTGPVRPALKEGK